MTEATRPDPRRWWTLGVLCLSLIVISLDNTILNVALPTLERDLGASASQLQWIVDAYMLVFAGLLLTAGALGDRFGRRRALTFGLFVFGAGSALSATATTPGMLIAARALMGVGGAFIMPSTLSIITNVFPAGERAKAIGIWAAFAGLGIAIGPVSGGWLVEHADWSWIFLVNLPFVAAALPLVRALVPESRDPAAPPLDLPGFALSTTGLVALVWAIIEAPERGWTDPGTLAGFAAALVTLGLFARWQLRSEHPMLDVRLFRNPRFSASSLAVSLAFFALFGMMFFITQYLQAILGYSAFEAGLRTLPVAGGLIAAGPASAKLAARLGAKLVVAAGLLIVGTGISLLAFADADTGYGLVAASLAVLGIGMGMAMAPATDAIMGSLPLEKASVGSAVNDATRITGGALGVAILGSVLSSGYRGGMEDAVAGMPAPAADTAKESLAGGLSVAAHAGGESGQQLLLAAQDAFLSGMHTAAIVAGVIAVAGSLVALLWLPARESQVEAEPAPVGELVLA
ncbi:MAG TPA: MFS transporter [Solirubrobacteraceae bacterium]|nr:MFS transporter [Solirubrobacteraceae bacterium]